MRLARTVLVLAAAAPFAATAYAESTSGPVTLAWSAPPEHLGFIIEDRPQSFAVDRGHDRVDLYGYVSMVVATMQVQDKQIRALQEELTRTRASCARR